MKVLLIQPPLNPHIVGAGDFYLSEPLALEVLAAAIPEHTVRILDMRLEQGLEQELDSFRPDAVGVTSYTPNVYAAKNVLRKAKEVCPNALTVVGGPHATLVPGDFNEEYIDVLVIGEGQVAFKELLRAHEMKKELSDVSGIALRRRGALFFTPDREPLADLDDMAIPARHLTERYRQKYFRGTWRPMASMITSAGCPYKCNFCSVWKLQKGRYRAQSPERVVREIESIAENYVSIADDNFLQDAARARKIAHLIKERGIKKIFKLIGRADSIVRHPDVVSLWKDIGMKMVFIGIESVKDEGLAEMNKKSSVKINSEAIRILHGLGITISAHFIIHPDFVKEDFEELYRYVKSMELTQPVFPILTPLPGTDLYEEKKDQLLIRDYEKYDFTHAIIPTKLPQREFYGEYIGLYKKCYLSEDNLAARSFVSEQTMRQIFSKLEQNLLH
ncbi:MAG: hypothetical protein A2293_13935 [Elusimicrobia bacterium RIFOXYB2_FULL_49_7]|nr:MAG: hypothetical protein A2293_13935 [Elusimicrobia bacterium RIFOXYB2_FULL_49_7]